MKKRYSILIGLLLVLFTAFPAFSAMTDYQASVYKWTGNYNQDGSPGMTKLTTGVTYVVLGASSTTAATLYEYNDRGLTAKTNPITTTVFATDKEIKFRTDPVESNDKYVDLIVTDTNGGYTAVIHNFDQYTHTIVIDERPNIMHHGIIAYTANTTGQVNTGVNFLANTMIHDVRIEVVTATATGGTADYGLGSDADGLRDNVSTATTGYVKDTGVITAGTTADYNAVSTYGALLYTAITGSDSSATVRFGGRSYLGYIVTSTTSGSILYTSNTSSGSGAGYIHYWFTRLR